MLQSLELVTLHKILFLFAYLHQLVLSESLGVRTREPSLLAAGVASAPAVVSSLDDQQDRRRGEFQAFGLILTNVRIKSAHELRLRHVQRRTALVLSREETLQQAHTLAENTVSFECNAISTKVAKKLNIPHVMKIVRTWSNNTIKRYITVTNMLQQCIYLQVR